MGYAGVCVCHLKPLSPSLCLCLSPTHTTHTHTLTLIHGFSDGISVSPVDLPAADGPDRLSGSVCDVFITHPTHTHQVNNFKHLFVILANLNETHCYKVEDSHEFLRLK